MASLCKTSSLSSNWSCFQLFYPIGSALLLFQTCNVDAFMCPETKPKSHLLHHEVDQHCSGQHEALCIRRSRARTDSTGSCCSTRGLRGWGLWCCYPSQGQRHATDLLQNMIMGRMERPASDWSSLFFTCPWVKVAWTDELSETDPPPAKDHGCTYASLFGGLWWERGHLQDCAGSKLTLLVRCKRRNRFRTKDLLRSCVTLEWLLFLFALMLACYSPSKIYKAQFKAHMCIRTKWIKWTTFWLGSIGTITVPPINLGASDVKRYSFLSHMWNTLKKHSMVGQQIAGDLKTIAIIAYYTNIYKQHIYLSCIEQVDCLRYSISHTFTFNNYSHFYSCLSSR